VKARFQNVRYVFLDRDGVINRKPPEGKYIAQWSDVEFLPGAEAAIAALNRSGRRVVVVSNQRGVALGYYTSGRCRGASCANAGAPGQAGRARGCVLLLSARQERDCDCRKPGTGMFLQAFRDLASGGSPAASASNSVVIGDSLSDIEAARSAGRPVDLHPGRSCDAEGRGRCSCRFGRCCFCVAVGKCRPVFFR
jgi:D-glycero-D-manno-heptose 1,7-bisphosphate phosphatase